MNQSRLRAIVYAASLLLPATVLWAQSAGQDTHALIEELGLEESGVAARDLPYWRKPKKIYIVPPGYNDEERAMRMKSAQEVVGDVELVQISYPIPDEVIRDAEVLLARCTPRIIREAKNLRWLQDSRHGVDSCMVPEIKDKQFVLTNAQHTSGPPIADHVIAMMTMLTRGLHTFHRSQLQGVWKERPIEFPMLELSDKTMLVVGLGGVGREVAKRANGLGMRVLGIRNTSRSGPDYVEYVGLSHEVHDLAGRADVIVNALPLTEDTRGLFDKKFFDSVKRGAYFISVGRGPSTVTDDLIAALKDGRLTAAGLDVTDPEPLPDGHELWSLENVVITPHVSATTDQGRWRRWEVIRENLRRYVNGEKMLNVVDVSRGY
ncbi:MAG: D-2-hydroxyacid dehydrogenase [Gammaproteobacteria bacterium]|nr:D-2-hydroxyacid dehydrogenase [Gammaproteobacteria bacterium]MDH3430606.1 D-2-hydroxyacid dehydrogenase [Gammaproteobacteria bacterium]